LLISMPPKSFLRMNLYLSLSAIISGQILDEKLSSPQSYGLPKNAGTKGINKNYTKLYFRRQPHLFGSKSVLDPHLSVDRIRIKSTGIFIAFLEILN